jgi:hypothetical protein
MNEIILHHCAFSSFSEKLRVALGLKGLAYRSVEIPGLPPRSIANSHARSCVRRAKPPSVCSGTSSVGA